MDMVSSRSSGRIRVLVADYSRIHSQLLSEALGRDPSLDVVPWDGDRSALIPLTVAQAVDVLAISSNLGDPSARSSEIVRSLRTRSPSTKVIVLLDSQKKEDVVDAFRAGARGIFSRDGSVEMFRKCIGRVHGGEIWADTREVSQAIEALASAPTLRTEGKSGVNILSKRELQVVQCLVQGMTNREIADEMGLSQHTVKNYLFRVFDKLGVSSRTELLFMTLNHEAKPDAIAYEIFRKAFDGEADSGTLPFVEKAAYAGVPAAQMALAQMYLKRRTEPDDLVQAYSWYLVACANTEQVRATLTSVLTPKQIREAQQKAVALVPLQKTEKPGSTRVIDSVTMSAPSSE